MSGPPEDDEHVDVVGVFRVPVVRDTAQRGFVGNPRRPVRFVGRRVTSRHDEEREQQGRRAMGSFAHPPDGTQTWPAPQTSPIPQQQQSPGQLVGVSEGQLFVR